MQCKLFCKIRSQAPTHTHTQSPPPSRTNKRMRARTRTAPSYLREVQVEEAEGEELQADGAAVEQPVGQRLQLVSLHHVLEVEGEEGRPQCSPQQAQEQKHALVAEALVSVVQDQPQLQVDEHEQERVEHRVDRSQAELQCWGDRASVGLLERGEQTGIDPLSGRKHLRSGLATNAPDAAKSKTLKERNWVRAGLNSSWMPQKMRAF